jgi:hypothetical protein
VPVSAKHILEKIAFHCQLTYGLKHLVAFLLQFSLLSADLFLGLALVEYAVGILDELSLPCSDHVWVQIVLGSYLSEFAITLEYFENDLGFEFRGILVS